MCRSRLRPILSALQTSTCKLAKYLAPTLEPLITNKYAVKDSFNLDIDSLFTNIPLEETIEICINNLFENNDTVHGLKKSEFKELLSLATNG